MATSSRNTHPLRRRFSALAAIFAGEQTLGVLPSRSNPRATTTVFDETISLPAPWAERIPDGLLVVSGDVALRSDASQVKLDRPGVTGIAMRLDSNTGSHHAVYVVGGCEQVHIFLQKPTLAEIKPAGGLRTDGKVAVDICLLHFDPELTSALTSLAAFKAFEIELLNRKGTGRP